MYFLHLQVSPLYLGDKFRLMLLLQPTPQKRNSWHHCPSTKIISIDVPYLVQANLTARKRESEAQWQCGPQYFMLCLEIHNTGNNVIKELQE